MSLHELPGTFARESFSLRRNPSICSVHGARSLKLQPSPRQSVCEKVPDVNIEAPRFNKSFHHFRYVVVAMGGLAVGFMSLLRLNITVAILNMVNQTQIYIEEHPEGADLEAHFGEGYEEVGEFEWSNERQQQIISYYMIAYTLPQLFTSKLAIKMGTRWSIPLSLALCAVSNLLTPVAAYMGYEYVLLLRLANGLGASAILPVQVFIVEQWMPGEESALGLAIVQFGQTVLFTTSPLISASLAEVHWKWAFYVPSIMALVFCFFWFYLVCDQPNECWLVSRDELIAICGCHQVATFGGLETATTKDSHGAHKHSENSDSPSTHEHPPVPWTKALKVPSFYALALIWIFFQCSFGSLSFLIPAYMQQILRVPIMENGFQCFVMQAGCMMSVIWPQPILRILQNRFKLSLTVSRRLVLAFICFTAVTTWLLVARFHEHQVILFSINRVIHLSTDTIMTSTLMSQYGKAGISCMVFSVINSIGSFTVVFFCMAVGEFLDLTGQSRECWSMVFVVMSIMNVAILILFSTVISSEAIELGDSSEESKLDCEQPGSFKPKFSEKTREVHGKV